MNIRRINDADVNIYWDLRLEALKQHPDAFATSYEEAIQRKNPIEGVANNLSNEANYTYGAFHNEELVGVVTLLQESPLKFRHKANLLAMYVTPAMRGLGVGKQLVTAAITKAKEIEMIEKINLTVVTSNEKAIKLYTKLGFETYGVEKKALKIDQDYYDEAFMTLEIN